MNYYLITDERGIICAKRNLTEQEMAKRMALYFRGCKAHQVDARMYDAMMIGERF